MDPKTRRANTTLGSFTAQLQNKSGDMPLLIATRKSFTKIMEVLLQHDGDKAIKQEKKPQKQVEVPATEPLPSAKSDKTSVFKRLFKKSS